MSDFKNSFINKYLESESEEIFSDNKEIDFEKHEITDRMI